MPVVFGSTDRSADIPESNRDMYIDDSDPDFAVRGSPLEPGQLTLGFPVRDFAQAAG